MAAKKYTDQSALLVSSMSLLSPSSRLAVKSYEQIIFLFFVPSLLSILGTIYLGGFLPAPTHLHLTNRHLIGLGFIVAWLVLSIINYPASIYFRVSSARNGNPPPLIECYRQGFKNFWRVLLTEMAAILIIAPGIAALLVPGVLLFRRYGMSAFYAMDNPDLKIREILAKSAAETKPFAWAIYSTYAFVIVVTFALEIISGSNVVGDILTVILTYSLLFIPALRYQEIIQRKVIEFMPRRKTKSNKLSSKTEKS